MNRRNHNLLLLIAFIATALTAVWGGVFVFRARDARRDLAMVADRLATEVAARMTAEAVAATHQAEVQVAATRVATGASARATEATARDITVAISATRQAEAQATAIAEVGRRQAAEAEKAEAEYQARRDRARALAAAVQLELSQPDYDPSLALLLSIEAVNTTWTTDDYVVLAADAALHDAVDQVEALSWRMSLPRHWHDGAVNSAAFSLNGKLIVIARRMSASAHGTAAVTTTTQADATELVRLREAMGQEWQSSLGLAPSYNDLLLVILAKALGEFPYMNAHLVDEEIRQPASINIGIAVDTERGLIVPVLKGVQEMLLADVARASRGLVQRARRGKLLADDLSGGTFTLSNMGAFDVEASTPIINLPECAILGVGRIAARPAVFDGELCVRQTVTLSLTYDHRAIDGAPAARFLERVKHLVEQPYLALVC